MSPMRAFSFRALLALGVICLLSWSPVKAQDEDERAGPVVPAEGMQMFRHKLHEAGLRPVRHWNDVMNAPHRTLIILLGDQSIRRYLRENDIKPAIQAGASILIATDQSTRGTDLRNLFSVEITGEYVDANPEYCFQVNGRALPYFPFVSPYLDVRGNDSPKRIFDGIASDGVGAVATNNPSVLQIINDPDRFPKPEPVAGYPSTSRTPRRDLVGRSDMFAVGGTSRNGRFLVLADHSVFLNMMLLANDGNDLLNSNLVFTEQCIDWLKGQNNNFDRCFFVEDGEVKTDFELQFPEPDDSDLGFILGLLDFLQTNDNGNRIISGLQEQDFFNRLLRRHYSTREIIRTVLIVLIALSIFYLFFATLRSRSSTDPARSLVTPELAAMIPKGDVLRQRFDSLLEVDNLYEASRQLIRDFLSGMNAEPDANGLPPRLVIEDGYDDEDGLRRRISRLWRIAYDLEPVHVAPQSWGQVKKDLQSILTDADEGWWKFMPRKPKG